MENPILSVIVCTYNRERYILRNLECLLNQTLDKSKYEVVLVNNNSPDNTDAICTEFIAAHPELQVTYSIEYNQGHTWARNRGIADSKGQYLAFIDDDAFVRPAYCEETIRFFEENPKVDVIGGKLYPLYDDCDEPKWMSKWLLPLVAALDMGDQPKPFAKRKFPTGANMAYRKECFDKAGVFDVELGRRGDGLEGGDEKDMVFRIKKVGGLVYYAPKVVVDHIIPPKRISMEYVKGLAMGVGGHERTRLQKEGAGSMAIKWALELVKIGGTALLYFSFFLKGQHVKGWTLVKFRYWVVMGLLGGKPHQG